MNFLEIEKVIGREIMDSRGNPTAEAEVTLADGTVEEAWHLRALRRESLRHWSFATEISQDTLEKVSQRQLKILRHH